MMRFMTKEQRKQLLDTIAKLRLIDDTFFHACFADNREGMEYVLRIIMVNNETKKAKTVRFPDLDKAIDGAICPGSMFP